MPRGHLSQGQGRLYGRRAFSSFEKQPHAKASPRSDGLRQVQAIVAIFVTINSPERKVARNIVLVSAIGTVTQGVTPVPLETRVLAPSRLCRPR